MATESADQRLVLFLKSFREGRVKTRLAAGLGAAQALAVYRTIVADLLCRLEPIGRIIVPYFSEYSLLPGSEGPLQGGTARGRIKVQRGNDLGERMANAFRDEFAAGAEEVLLIGSDIPRIDAALIREYFRQLRRVPMVIGPAADGGYYLIGFRRGAFKPQLFTGIPWSSDAVLGKTVEKARALGLRCRVGPQLRDVDTVDDLETVLGALEPGSTLSELVQRFLVEIGA